MGNQEIHLTPFIAIFTLLYWSGTQPAMSLRYACMLKANMYMKRSPTARVIREMQIKTIRRYPFITIRLVIITKTRDNKCWHGCAGKGTPVHHWWECKLM